MRQNRFLFYLLAQIVVILAVIGIFQTIEDVKVASTLAGSLFVLMPVVLMAFESLRAGFRHRVWFAGVLQFWLLFAIPILGLRVFNWQMEFSELSFMGVHGPTLHFWSNKSYFVMMFFTMLLAWKYFRHIKTQNNP